ncbi:MAG: cytochrome c [Bacteroidota bacterium]
MKPFTLLFIGLLFVTYACSPSKQEAANTDAEEGKGLVGYVELTDPLDESMIKQGRGIFTSKCASCHTLDTVQFAVPSFAGVTNRRAPEWIMNMIMNVDQMLQNDPTAADLLKKHKIQMPDPNLKVDEARAVLEFLRNNDLQQLGEKDLAATR